MGTPTNTPDVSHDENKRTEMAFSHIALDPQCEIFIQYLEAEKRAILNLMGDVRVRANTTMTQSYAGELKAYDDILMNIYDHMASDKKEARERSTKLSGWKRFFNFLLTRKLKTYTPQK